MAGSTNMICPSCGTFQDLAEVCSKCGVIIEKVLNAAVNYADKKSAESENNRSLTAKIAVMLLITIPVIGFILFSGTDNGQETVGNSNDQEKTDKLQSSERIAAFNPAIAENVQRTNVKSKLHSIRTNLNVYLVEGGDPPTNEEGLQLLVDSGYLSQAEITDEWGNIYEYRLELDKETPWGQEYKIFVHSRGPDGVSGNADDVGI